MKNEFKGTPGPWHVSNEGNLVVRDNEWYMPMAHCGEATNEEESHNAHLIAAAPELLKALQELTALYEDDEGCRNLTEYKRAKAAISKALGETK